jgi:hypothetical protein
MVMKSSRITFIESDTISSFSSQEMEALANADASFEPEADKVETAYLPDICNYLPSISSAEQQDTQALLEWYEKQHPAAVSQNSISASPNSGNAPIPRSTSSISYNHFTFFSPTGNLYTVSTNSRGESLLTVSGSGGVHTQLTINTLIGTPRR